MIWLEMKKYNMILTSDKIHQYEYFTCEEIVPPNWRQIIERAKFTYSPLRKALEK